MSVTFSIHVEPAGDKLVWWADTPAVPGLSVAADSLRDLRALVEEAIGLHLPRESDVRLELVGVDPEPELVAAVPVPDGFRPEVPASVGLHSRVTVMDLALAS